MKRKIYAAKAGDIMRSIITPITIQIINPKGSNPNRRDKAPPIVCIFIDLRNNCKMNYYFDNLFDMLEWEKIG